MLSESRCNELPQPNRNTGWAHLSNRKVRRLRCRCLGSGAPGMAKLHHEPILIVVKVRSHVADSVVDDCLGYGKTVGCAGNDGSVRIINRVTWDAPGLRDHTVEVLCVWIEFGGVDVGEIGLVLRIRDRQEIVVKSRVCESGAVGVDGRLALWKVVSTGGSDDSRSRDRPEPRFSAGKRGPGGKRSRSSKCRFPLHH